MDKNHDKILKKVKDYLDAPLTEDEISANNYRYHPAKTWFMKDINGAIDIRPSTTTKNIAIKKDWLNDPTYSINNEMKYIGEINFVEFINYKN